MPGNRLTFVVAALEHCGESIAEVHVVEGDLGGRGSIRYFCFGISENLHIHLGAEWGEREQKS